MTLAEQLALAGVPVEQLGSPNAEVRFWAGAQGGSLWIRTDVMSETIEFPPDAIPFGRFLFHQIASYIQSLRAA